MGNMYCGQLYFLLIAFIALVIPSHAKTIFVDDNASDGGDGTSWASAHKYLQDALAVAEYGDEIWVAEGTYKPDQGAGKTAGDRSSPFVLVNGVAMYGGFLGTESSRNPQGDNNQTILSGEINEDSELWSLNVVSGVNLDTKTILDGFRITKGNANGESDTVYENGGGVYLSDSNMTVSNLVITNNSAGRRGGGIYSYSDYFSPSSLTLTNCVFTNNSASETGGGIDSSLSNLTLTNCVFTNNSAGNNGGGIWSSSSSVIMAASTNLNLTNCVFTNNSAGDGGGIYSNYEGKITLTDCVFTNNSARYGDGGGISSYYSSSLTLNNCVFTNNSAGRRGGGISSNYSSSLTLNNCVFTNNSASENGGGIYSDSSSSLTLTNCVLWKNTSNSIEGHGLEGESFRSVVLQEAVKAEYPGDPNAKDAVYEPNLNILQGWDGDARAFDADPLFVNIDNPIGPDGIWFTDDDGLRVAEDSPAIDAGYNESLPADVGDVDNDGNFDEIIPLDPIGYRRVQNGVVDIGAYEFGDSMIETHQVKTSVSHEGYGVVTGGGVAVEVGESVEINADPNQGYIFTGWSGDANGSSNPLTITVDSAKSISANFVQDLNDTDGDGLTNYAELVTHGTKVDDNDTDNDGLLDNEEIQIGTDPNISNLNIVNFLNSKATSDQDNARSAGQTTGIDMVKANPSSYGLYSSEDMNASIANAKSESETFVTSNPSAYNLVTKSSYDQALLDANATAEQAIADAKVSAKAEGQSAGINLVKTNPSTYGLYSSADLNASIESALSEANPATAEAIANAKVEGIEEGKTMGITEGESSVISNPSAYNLVTQSAYDEMMNELMSASDADTTPYSEGWFYLPNRGWLWTTRTTYPYFFDNTSKAWMYFQSGNEKPKFYHYGTKEWMTVE